MVNYVGYGWVGLASVISDRVRWRCFSGEFLVGCSSSASSAAAASFLVEATVLLAE